MVTGLLYTMQVTKKTNNTLDLNYLENSILSIQISLDGFSFCILNTDLKEIIALYAFDFFDKNPTPESLLENIKKLYLEEPLLTKKFKSVIVSIKNNLNTFVPSQMFDPELASYYLQHTVKVLKNDFIEFDELTEFNLTNVYIPYVNITNYLLDIYGSFNYQHNATALLTSLLNINKANGGTNVYANVSKTEVDLIVLNEGNLVLYNTHKITSSEDFIYFLLFTFEQLGLDLAKDNLILLGTIDKQADNYYHITKYIRNVSFLCYEYKYPAEMLKAIENHKHFVVLNQF